MTPLIIACTVSTALLCGCDAGNRDNSRVAAQNTSDRISGGVITIEKKTADRFRVFNICGEKRTISFSADMEYPSVFGIHKNEYQKLTELVDGMFNDGTNFEVSVENVSKELFTLNSAVG